MGAYKQEGTPKCVCVVESRHSLLPIRVDQRGGEFCLASPQRGKLLAGRRGVASPSCPDLLASPTAGTAPYQDRPLGGRGAGWAGGDGGALILTGAARLWNEGRRRPPARPVRSVLGPERSRAQRARPRQRSRVQEGGGARRSQRPDMPRTRGRCTPAAAYSQPARRPHARVPLRRAARGLRPGPSARGQQ